MKLNYISLVNLILNRLVVKELIQDELNLSNLCMHLESILEPLNKKQFLDDYQELKSILGNGGASKKTAQLIYDRITSEKN